MFEREDAMIDQKVSMQPVVPPESHMTDASPSRMVPGWIGIVSIVLGMLGLMCWGAQGVSVVFTRLSSNADMIEPTLAHRVFVAGEPVAGTVLGILLLVGGIGVLRGLSWSVGVLRLWAWIRLLIVIVSLVATFYWMDETIEMTKVAMAQEMEAAPETVDSDFSLTDDALRGFMTIWVIVISAAACIWPILVLALCRRREI